MKDKPVTAEQQKLLEHRERRANWRHWGPYLSERAWGTVREDYSTAGDAWQYFPFEHSHRRAYRWNEDGLAGICDRHQYLCFAVALWNGHDAILKERLFGLTGPQGNHGEDVKEYYFYLDNTPTHSYMEMLYKYPQQAFPYDDLLAENARRGYDALEYELLDTGVFDDNHYFDVFVRYAKASQDDIVIEIEVYNRASEAAPLTLLPTLWFRNTWAWGYPAGPMDDVASKPRLRQGEGSSIYASHPTLGDYTLYADANSSSPEAIFTENDTDLSVFGRDNQQPYVKDAFHRVIVEGDGEAVNPAREGSKGAFVYRLDIPAQSSQTVHLRLSDVTHDNPFADAEAILANRKRDADAFYNHICNPTLSEDERRIQRQAFAGMLWGKQLYYYDIAQWLKGDPILPAPPQRQHGRNAHWQHLHNFDVISMPDKWEYPWYATWDSAFHCLPLAVIDPDYAKRQLVLFLREWYMHPNGQLPAYEWNFEDVNPPVHAWAAWRVYKIDAKASGKADRAFLERVFHKLMLNFTWWVNRKDAEGNNIFEGGFLGMDNVSVFDRSADLPGGGHIEQSDATAWMGFFSLTMMQMALELAKDNPIYQDTASKFLEHFLGIATALNNCGNRGYSLWDENDRFFYDVLHLPNGDIKHLKVRSLVGILTLFAVETLEPDIQQHAPDFERRLNWFVDNRPWLAGNMASVYERRQGERRHISLLTETRLRSVLHYLLDENEFLSPYGIRSLSKIHEHQPYTLHLNGTSYTVGYLPAESDSGLFGGNSNWRGPIWFPMNFLIIESLQKFHHFYGDDFKVAFPTGSDNYLTLWEVATELSTRLIKIFTRDQQARPVYGGSTIFQDDPHWRNHVLFYEYFHGDNGAGLGASHQTGWTGLVAKLIQQSGGANDTDDTGDTHV
jgi:hypothetical protein